MTFIYILYESILMKLQSGVEKEVKGAIYYLHV